MKVRVEGIDHEANFVKIAVNVIRRDDSDENVLPDLLGEWFGPEAGQPGRGEQVVFEWNDHGCTLRPITTDTSPN